MLRRIWSSFAESKYSVNTNLFCVSKKEQRETGWSSQSTDELITSNCYDWNGQQMSRTIPQWMQSNPKAKAMKKLSLWVRQWFQYLKKRGCMWVRIQGLLPSKTLEATYVRRDRWPIIRSTKTLVGKKMPLFASTIISMTPIFPKYTVRAQGSFKVLNALALFFLNARILHWSHSGKLSQTPVIKLRKCDEAPAVWKLLLKTCRSHWFNLFKISRLRKYLLSLMSCIQKHHLVFTYPC